MQRTLQEATGLAKFPVKDAVEQRTEQTSSQDYQIAMPPGYDVGRVLKRGVSEQALNQEVQVVSVVIPTSLRYDCDIRSRVET
jgi:hypothetical protein